MSKVDEYINAVANVEARKLKWISRGYTEATVSVKDSGELYFDTHFNQRCITKEAAIELARWVLDIYGEGLDENKET